MPTKYLLSAYSMLGAVLSTLYLLTYLIFIAILRGRDCIISAALLKGKLKYRKVQQLAPSWRRHGNGKVKIQIQASGFRV